MSGLGGGPGILPFNLSSISNQTNICNSTHCDQVDTSAHVFFMVVYCLMFLVGLFLNGFTLKVYFCRAQQQASSCVTYLKNLAAADFLISLCLPIRIINYASSSVPVRQVYCNFGASAFYLNMYLKIVHPLGTHILQTVRTAQIISMVTWVFLLSMTITYIILSVFTQETLASVPDTVSCDVLHSKQVKLLYKVIHTCSAAIFLLVLVSLVFFYYSTSRRLSLAQQKQPASSSSKKLAKSRRNMLVLVSVFCVCFVPYHLVRLPYAFLSSMHGAWSQAFFYLKELTIMVSVLNVCLDPLIYFIFCKAFRAHLSLRRAFSTTQAATHGENTETRSSDGRMNAAKINGEMTLGKMAKPSGML
ncbi:P2Y purinoceptor 14-like isoform X2 [Chelmon rostratus]|uniref:P2Y purinoceptor 14-like isoform X2 n=1 Tax=Chelmon rostratus TaxID=109905 RepID=UPI001BE73CB0|nr:P2Y purinoceptor 14-like isoform X2 [Chelmon rostratus]